jgi:hypothetical protein
VVEILIVEELAQTLFASASTTIPTITLIGSTSIDTLEGCGSHEVAFVVVVRVLQE